MTDDDVGGGEPTCALPVSQGPSVARRSAFTRATLIRQAGFILVGKGANAFSLAAVAEASGVTKGGLLHHFPSRARLIEGMFDAQLERIEVDIDTRLETSGFSRGCFTRAYIASVLSEAGHADRPWSVLARTLIIAPHLEPKWADWLRTRLLQHAATDGEPLFATRRLMAGGLWIRNAMSSTPPPPDPAASLLERFTRP